MTIQHDEVQQILKDSKKFLADMKEKGAEIDKKEIERKEALQKTQEQLDGDIREEVEKMNVLANDLSRD